VNLRLVVLGATGSIGRQTLEVAKILGIRVVGISVHTRVDAALKIAREFGVEVVAVTGPDSAKPTALENVKLVTGERAVEQLVKLTAPDTVVVAVPGVAGLDAVLQTYPYVRRLCLANKESVVVGGRYLKRLLNNAGVEVLPVDSEHSAVLQLLEAAKPVKVILTASGGALRDLPLEELESATVSQVLAHPNWQMGAKVTVDSATMVNKGLELFEAMWFFDLAPHQVDAAICRDSFVHAAVVFEDGVMKLHAGFPDMRVPIAYALTKPERCWKGKVPELVGRAITFEPVPFERYPAFALAKEILRERDTLKVAYCVADELAVDAFLKGKIRFGEIYRIIEKVVESVEATDLDSWEEIEEALEAAQRISKDVMKRWK